MIKKILNSKILGYVVGILITVAFGASHIDTLEESEKFSK